MIILFTFLVIFIIGFLIFGRSKKNIYIETHKKKWKHERDYNDYIKWLDKSKMYDMPIKKIKTIEDKIFENKIHDAIK